MGAKEVDFQQDLYFQLRKTLAARLAALHEKLEDVRMEFTIDHGRADIAVLRPGGRPFLIIETKRKNGREQKDIDPLSPAVIKQAIGYASLSGAPYFATANETYIAVFRVPDPGEQFRIERHRVFVSPIPALTQDFAEKLLRTVTDYHDARSDRDRARIATDLNWTFIVRLRSFVDWLTRRIAPAIETRFASDDQFKKAVEAFEKEVGAGINANQLTREMAYVLMNKLVFRKALERRYTAISKLRLNPSGDPGDLLVQLRASFDEAMTVTGNFEAIFGTGIYDEVRLAGGPHDLVDLVEGIGGFIDDMETYRLEDLGADIIGHVYEGLIPAIERHRLGQFYTPPAIAEALVAWAVSSEKDKILDPASGSGTFVVKAYQRLKTLKDKVGHAWLAQDLHREVVEQLFALDINPFPVQLTAMNLAIRELRYPVTETNIIERDFFQLGPEMPALVPYLVKTPAGEGRRTVAVPQVDAIVANPPYTRWLEVPSSTRDAIERRLGPLLQRYGLTARIRGGVETALYQHFVVHGQEFLREGGRMAMIVSDSWLQTDVGVPFSAYLLDHFKVHAVLDLGARVFEVPLVSACLILLEKCGEKSERERTDTLFGYVDEPLTVDELLGIIRSPRDHSQHGLLRVARQGDLPRDRKWIEVLFGFAPLMEKVFKTAVEASSIFDVTRGTIRYCAEKSRGLGANEFFYFKDAKAKQWGVPSTYLARTISSSRYSTNFVFSDDDWKAMRTAGAISHVLNASEPIDKLPEGLKGYIKWGQTECRTRDGAICASSQACQERARKKDEYAGWYDLGGVVDAQIFAAYYGRYLRRFCLLDTPLALDSDFICFGKSPKLKPDELKAVLACLNAPLVQAFIELWCRTSGGVVLGMEAKQAARLPILDPTKLKRRDLAALGGAFDRLERKARETEEAGGPDFEKHLGKELADLNKVVCSLMGLTARDATDVQKAWRALRERRLSREPMPEGDFVKGSEPRLDKPPKRARKPKRAPRPSKRLDQF